VLEFTLALLVLIPMLMGVFDLGRAVFASSVVAAAAQEAARYGIVHRSDVNGMEAAARSRAVGLSPSQMTVAVSFPDSTRVEVAVSYTFTALTPLIGDLLGEEGQLTLSSTACMNN